MESMDNKTGCTVKNMESTDKDTGCAVDKTGSEDNNIIEDEERLKKINEMKLFWSEKRKDLHLTEDLSGLSKNQQKKLLRHRVFMEQRPERRREEREKNKLKRAQKKEAGLPLPVSRRSKKKRKLDYSNYKVAIDLDFYDKMNEKDLRMVLKQIKTCYAVNRNHVHPLRLSLTSFNDQLKDYFLQLQPGINNWDIQIENSSYLDAFEKDSIVYLTSDSENVLDTIDENKMYIIGGLVDHNNMKGLCYKMAVENGIAHAQLPIEQFVKMKGRKVLTINHVFEILLEYSDSKDWKSAFFKVLPNRKGISDISDEKSEENEKGTCANNDNINGDNMNGDNINGDNINGDNSENCSTSEDEIKDGGLLGH